MARVRSAQCLNWSTVARVQLSMSQWHTSTRERFSLERGASGAMDTRKYAALRLEDAKDRAGVTAARVVCDHHFVVQLNHFIPGFRS